MRRERVPARVALALTVLLAGGCDVGESLQRMSHQSKVESYGEESFFPDGVAMRAPPEGTVARGTALDDPLKTEGERDGVYADRIQAPVTRALFERGRERYTIYCTPCHGVLGDGHTVVAERMKLRSPPSILTVTDIPGRLYKVIAQGYGLMPAYDHALSVEDRWAVVAYVRALQRSQRMSLDALPEPQRAQALQALEAADREAPSAAKEGAK